MLVLNLALAGQSASARVDNEKRHLWLTLSFESGGVLIYDIKFPEEIEKMDVVEIISWTSNEPSQSTGCQLVAEIFFTLDGVNYVYQSTSKEGWKRL